MSTPESPEIGAVCPYLGLADDPDSHATYATEAHRCYRMPTPTRIALTHQERYCLGAEHTACPVYRGEGVPGAQPQPARPAPARPAARPRTAGTLGARRGGGISMPVATVGLFALALGLVVLAIVIQNLIGGNGGGELTPADRLATQEAQARQTPGSGGEQQPTPTVGGQQTAVEGSPTAAPTTPAADGTATPTATTGSGGQTYVVQPGDTCSSIAERFGTTVDAIREANGLDEDCTIFVDQELVIP